MSRIEFMRELESLLSDIPIEERKEAIQYYNDYFEDAGEDHEEEIIKELGSPARIAGIIKADLSLSGEEHENRGYFTEKGYQDTVYTDEKYEIIKTAKHDGEENANRGASTGETGNKDQGYSNNRYGYTSGTGQNGNSQAGYNQSGYHQNGSSQSGYRQTGNSQAGNSQAGNQGATGQSQPRNNTNIALIILLAIFAIPIGIPIMFAIFGTFFGLIAASFGIVIGFGAAGVAMIAVGLALFFVGIVQINIPLALLISCGAGLVVFGLGILFLLFSVMICKKLIPALIRGITALCRLPFKNRSVTV